MQRRISVRRSAIHGRGVFAVEQIEAGLPIIDYRGAVVRWSDAVREYHDSDAAAGHTFLFDLGDGTVLDGGRKGNSARWINHGCDPNCEAVVDGRTITIQALRDLKNGDELLLDYRLELQSGAGKDARAEYACRCGAPRCRLTMLAG